MPGPHGTEGVWCAGIFLDSPTVSSRHAIICAPCLFSSNLASCGSLAGSVVIHGLHARPATLAQQCKTLRPAPADVEGAGTAPFVQDLNSKNEVGRRSMPVLSIYQGEELPCRGLRSCLSIRQGEPKLAPQTFLERVGGGVTVLQGMDRYSVREGESVRFGSVRCQIHLASAQQVRGGQPCKTRLLVHLASWWRAPEVTQGPQP